MLPSSLVGDLLTAVLLGIVTAHLGIIWAIGRVRLGDAPIAIMLVICFVAWISLAPGLVAEESGVRTALRRGWQMIRVTFGPLVLYSGITGATGATLQRLDHLADAAPDSLYDPVAPDSTQSWHAYALYGLFRLGQLVSLAFFYCVVIVLYFKICAPAQRAWICQRSWRASNRHNGVMTPPTTSKQIWTISSQLAIHSSNGFDVPTYRFSGPIG